MAGKARAVHAFILADKELRMIHILRLDQNNEAFADVLRTLGKAEFFYDR